ncbi:MAG: mannitol dehydrogenase family protein [Propionibacteriaceae bacterium]|nr:mannitol dehydrogenase family protein [Propionibacteriaceae bacterium]
MTKQETIIRLSTLSGDFSEVPVETPSYDRSAITCGVVHIGVGGFHRAHQAVFFDRVLSAGDLRWGIVGVGLMPNDKEVSRVAGTQGGLYTLTELSPDGGAETRVIGSILDVLFAPEDPGRVLELMAAPTTHIVSLTITEGGYGIDDATGEFMPTDSLTLADLAGSEKPQSAWGFLAAALRIRRERGLAPFTVMTCDNIQGNGEVAKLALTSFVGHSDEEFANWIQEKVAFPSSMVDRITPIVTSTLSSEVAARTGVDDAWPVQSESFLQWVIEDSFSSERPPLGDAGVQIVADVEPYERMKLRLLNASHQAMGYLGLLAGFDLVHEACRDQTFAAFLRRYMHTEAIPTLGDVPGVDLHEYCEQLMERFSSDAVRDTLARQVVDGSDRLPKFVLPVLREQLATGGAIDCVALVLAGWGVYLESFLSDGSGPLPDRRAVDLLEIISQKASQPGALLSHDPVFGNLAGDERLLTAYLDARREILAAGALPAVEAVVGQA